MDASSVSFPVTITVSTGGPGMMVSAPTAASAATPEALTTVAVRRVRAR